MSIVNKIKRLVFRFPLVDRLVRSRLFAPVVLDGISYRLYGKDDSPEDLTRLINNAYLVYAERGLAFAGVSQRTEETVRRLRHAYTFIAIDNDRLIGTISYKPYWECRGSRWFNISRVAKFNQLAVDPLYQGRGIGGVLLGIVEQVACIQGATELALDTSEEAIELVDFYKKRSYRFIDYHNWDFTNYRSVILSKKLGGTSDGHN